MNIFKSYFICATPRTGSTYLCEILKNTGLMGNPEEYFEFLASTGLPRQPIQYFQGIEDIVSPLLCNGGSVVRDNSRLNDWSSDGYRRYVIDIINKNATSNGVFGAKMMYGYFGDFLDRLFWDNLPPPTQHIHSYLKHYLNGLSYIWIRRADKLKQAISLWKAIQTQEWRRDVGNSISGAGQKPIFSFEAITYLRNKLAEEDIGWKNYFCAIGQEPLVLYYENIIIDIHESAAKALEHLGVRAPVNFTVKCPNMVAQYDDLSRSWLEEYMHQAAARSKSAQCAALAKESSLFEALP